MDRLRPTALLIACAIVFVIWLGFSFSGESVASAFQLLQSDLADDVRQGALQIVAHAGAFALATIGLTGLVSWGGKLIEPASPNDAAEALKQLIDKIDRLEAAPKSDDILK